MFLWFAGTALAAVWYVFRDPAFDHRLVMVGAVLPDLVDLPLGGARVAHTLVASVVFMFAVMATTRGRRVARRSLLALPIGTFLHLVFDGIWSNATVFWWPFFGLSFDGAPLPAADRAVLLVPMELVGAALLWWFWRRFGLDDATRRRTFLLTGRVDRALLAGPEPGTC